MHKESVLRQAIESGRNCSSIAHHLQYSYVVRPCGEGAVRLVGAEPAEDEIAYAVQLAEILRVKPVLDWRLVESSIELSMVIGSATFVSGVVSPPVALRNLWPDSVRGSNCFCGRQFGGTMKISASLITGWSSLLSHLALDHGAREGMTLIARVSDQSLSLLTIS